MTPNNAIHLSHLSSYYGNHAVLQDLNLTISAGKTVLLWGNNGAGKTTLLKIIASRLRPTQGKALVFGNETTKTGQAVRQQVCYLPVTGGFYGGLTGQENLELAGLFYQRTPAEVTNALELVGLKAATDAFVRTYSSGMQKRLSLAKLYLSQAPLWLLDEPYASLDDVGKDLVDDFLQQAKNQGRTVVVASHQMARVLPFADGALQLNNGKLTPNKP